MKFRIVFKLSGMHCQGSPESGAERTVFYWLTGFPWANRWSEENRAGVA